MNLIKMLKKLSSYCSSRSEPADNLGNWRYVECDGCKFVHWCKNNNPIKWDEESIIELVDRLNKLDKGEYDETVKAVEKEEIK